MASDSNKKILIFSTAYFPHIGGAEIAVREITRRIESIEFDMVTTLLDSSGRFEVMGRVNVYRVGIRGVGAGINKFLFPFLGALKAVQLHRERRYTAIWSIMASFSGFAALFFKYIHRKVPFILTLQEGDPIPDIKRKVFIMYPLFKAIFKKADKIQAISTYLAQFGKDMGYEGTPVVIPNGVDISLFAADYPADELQRIKERLGKTPDKIFLATTSRLVKKNAIDDVIQALTYLPDFIHFLIIGEGPQGSMLRNLAKKAHVSHRCVFLGAVDYKEIPKYLKSSDIFIRPSRSEGMGNSFIEAMAAGIPVIGTAVGGIPDFLKDKETGFVCKVNDPKSIAGAVQYIIANRQEAGKVVYNAQALAGTRYDWNVVSKEMEKVLTS